MVLLQLLLMGRDLILTTQSQELRILVLGLKFSAWLHTHFAHTCFYYCLRKVIWGQLKGRDSIKLNPNQQCAWEPPWCRWAPPGGHFGSNWNARGPLPALELNQTRTGLRGRGQGKRARHCQHPFLSPGFLVLQLGHSYAHTGMHTHCPSAATCLPTPL